VSTKLWRKAVSMFWRRFAWLERMIDLLLFDDTAYLFIF